MQRRGWHPKVQPVRAPRRAKTRIDSGAYTPSSTGRSDAPTAYGEVVIYALEVTLERAGDLALGTFSSSPRPRASGLASRWLGRLVGDGRGRGHVLRTQRRRTAAEAAFHHAGAR